MLSQQYQNTIKTILEKIEEAEVIVVGGAAGMSEAAGYNWYSNDEAFRKRFKNFVDKYNIDCMFNGFYYRFPTREERWGYLATLGNFIHTCEVGQPYLDLFKLLEGKDYFIVTTNQDTQFSKLFPQEKVSTIQGDSNYYQCSVPCHDEIYPNKEYIKKMYESIEGTKVSSELIPTCPKCGQDMEPWVRSYTFLEGRRYRSELNKYNRYLLKNKDKKVLFLELGVGTMTPMFIKEPFWNMTYRWPNAYYITINPKDALLPKELNGKGLAVKEDIAKVFQDIVKEKEVNNMTMINNNKELIK